MRIPERNNDILLDEFVIMLNHFRGIVLVNHVGAIHKLPQHDDTIYLRKMLLPKIMGYFKMNSAKQINQLRETLGFSVWQRNYYERIVRNYKALCVIRQYIFDNPMNWE